MRTLLSLAFAIALAPTAFAGGMGHDSTPPGFNDQVVANADGTIARGGKGFSVIHFATGQYEVQTSADVKNCAYIVTAGSGDATLPVPAIATAVRKRENRAAIMVSTFDHAGGYTDSGFHLIVRCIDSSNTGSAVVDSDGTFARGVFASSSSRTGPGAYTVTFTSGSATNICAFAVSVGLSGTSGTSGPGFATVSSVSGGTIAVQTYDTKGDPGDRGFHVFASCPA